MAHPAGLEVEVVDRQPVLRLRLTGALDILMESALLDVARPALDAGARAIEVDCAGLTFCDSGGLRSLILLRNQVAEDGSVTIRQPSPTLRRLLEITSLTEAFGLA